MSYSACRKIEEINFDLRINNYSIHNNASTEETIVNKDYIKISPLLFEYAYEIANYRLSKQVSNSYKAVTLHELLRTEDEWSDLKDVYQDIHKYRLRIRQIDLMRFYFINTLTRASGCTTKELLSVLNIKVIKDYNRIAKWQKKHIYQ